MDSKILKSLASVLIVVLVGGLILSRLGNVDYSYTGGPTVTGCSRLGPITKSIVYKENESFTATFLNHAGTSIVLDDVRVYEAITAMNCTVEAPSKGMKVGAGDTFKMDATCPGSYKNFGDTYSVDVNITFTSFEGGQNLTHLESGSIRGAVEK